MPNNDKEIIKSLEEELQGLRQMLQSHDYTQGQIDIFAVQDTELESLRRENKELVTKLQERIQQILSLCRLIGVDEYHLESKIRELINTSNQFHGLFTKKAKSGPYLPSDAMAKHKQ